LGREVLVWWDYRECKVGYGILIYWFISLFFSSLLTLYLLIFRLDIGHYELLLIIITLVSWDFAYEKCEWGAVRRHNTVMTLRTDACESSCSGASLNIDGDRWRPVSTLMITVQYMRVLRGEACLVDEKLIDMQSQDDWVVVCNGIEWIRGKVVVGRM